MLNVNIGQLLAHCGIRPVPGASTLGNLHVLMRHFLTLNHAHANGQILPPQQAIPQQQQQYQQQQQQQQQPAPMVKQQPPLPQAPLPTGVPSV
jgi:hypothetical protein